MSDSWWAKKLRENQPPPRPGIPLGTPQPSTPHVPQYQAPPPQVGVPPQHAPEGQVVQLDADHVNVSATLAQQTSVIPEKAVGNRTETASCPECGGNNFFSRAQGIVRGPAPAPQCFDCGYPLVQSGSGAGSLSGAAASGSTRPAKQVGDGGGWHPEIIVGRI